MRAKLNGIGFAQPIDLEVDDQLHLTVLDVSRQPSLLALPGKQATATRRRCWMKWTRWPSARRNSAAPSASISPVCSPRRRPAKIEASLLQVAEQVKQQLQQMRGQ